MYNVALLLAFLACAGHGRRVQTPGEQAAHDLIADQFEVADRTSDSPQAWRSLAMLLESLVPAAAFTPPSQQPRFQNNKDVVTRGGKDAIGVATVGVGDSKGLVDGVVQEDVAPVAAEGPRPTAQEILEAEPLLNDVMELTRRSKSPEHTVKTLKDLSQYANALGKLARQIDAEPLVNQVLELAGRILGPPQGSLDQQTLTEPRQIALELTRRFLSAEQPDKLKTLISYAHTLGELGRQAEAALTETESLTAVASLAPPALDAVKPQELVAKAYEQCEKITAQFSKTFYLGTKFMSEDQRKAVWAIYTWCRRTDDLVDSPLRAANAETMEADLVAWRSRLQNLWDGLPTDSLDLALIDARKKYPTLDIQPFVDMIDGMVMDTPTLGQDRYNTWEDLYLYCYRVASTVGLMTLPVMGTAEGYTEEEAKSPAVALGIALQITNILRDVGEDAQTRGRIYLPLEDMERFGVTEGQILRGDLNENYINLIKFEIQRARDYYKEAQKGIPMLAPSSRLAVQAAGDMYGQILDKIEQNGYDNFKKRAFTSKPEKIITLLSSWWKVSQMRP